MYVTVARPVRLRLADREIRLQPGRLQQLKLTTTQVGRIVGRVDLRVLRLGSTVTWESPLFGRCEGRVNLLPEGEWLGIEEHPITAQSVLVPIAWITAILADDDKCRDVATKKA